MIRRAGVEDIPAVNRLLDRDFPGLDFSEVLAEPMNVVLTDGDSGAAFAWRGPDIYEVHVFFGTRGREAIRLGHAMLDFMRREHGARFFWSVVPVASRHVKMFTRLMGWASHGIVETRHGHHELFALEN